MKIKLLVLVFSALALGAMAHANGQRNALPMSPPPVWTVLDSDPLTNRVLVQQDGVRRVVEPSGSVGGMKPGDRVEFLDDRSFRLIALQK